MGRCSGDGDRRYQKMHTQKQYTKDNISTLTRRTSGALRTALCSSVVTTRAREREREKERTCQVRKKKRRRRQRPRVFNFNSTIREDREDEDERRRRKTPRVRYRAAGTSNGGNKQQ